MITYKNNLVSIVVITYNSSDFILETLDSIYNQSYSPIELIISDDHSSDNTLPICKMWLSFHHSRFANALILESDKNTGVSANCNRGESKASGRWVKPIAGDDILVFDAIEVYVNYMLSHSEITFLFGKVQAFSDNSIAVNAYHNDFNQFFAFYNMSAREQYDKLMLNECCIPAASFFYDRIKNLSIGIHNDEDIPMQEDYPKWINITKRNIKLFYMDTMTVKYRLHSHSISSFYNSNNSPFVASRSKTYLKYQFGYHLKHHPRLAIMKYVKIKQYLTQKRIWFILETIGRKVDPLYRKLKKNNHCDWDNVYVF